MDFGADQSAGAAFDADLPGNRTANDRAVGAAVIQQAIGIIRSRSGGTADEALQELDRLSESANTELALIAHRLVDEAVRRAQTDASPVL